VPDVTRLHFAERDYNDDDEDNDKKEGGSGKKQAEDVIIPDSTLENEVKASQLLRRKASVYSHRALGIASAHLLYEVKMIFFFWYPHF
jgi:hypothetical protein